MRQYYFNPFSFLLILVLIVLLLVFLPLLFLGVIGGAFRSLGFSGWEVFFLILASIIGSFINIPVTRIEGARNRAYQFRDRFGRVYAVHEGPDTTVAVNVGGVVVPLFVTLYLVYYVLSSPALFPAPLSVIMGGCAGILLVAGITHSAAKVVPGMGIATPIFLPPLCALMCGILFSFGDPLAAPPIAFAGGTMGTLIGADLLNWRHLDKIGAPMVSIGGAGTFDGIFLSGILAAFLA
ncbi:DUF1614 domain-containing protein [Methanogenium sp. S4BF]|uniref:DUF1614 domain-containing protein n=1 Tax=Methanogenium sp. S4BF TaxID=1789226 RepID=UPI0024167553|nr:DUF1614 domain-containing protein [Methanogenium sp. S4BF]WFN33577.1 DUF1614 domain-containing protein [Methanogenium sp. S4BF]